MRKLKFTLALMLLLTCSTGHWLVAQDTTALRFAGFSDSGDLVMFKNDTSNLYFFPVNANASYHALFHHPQTGQLYCLFDSTQAGGRRNFFEIDPFSGAMSHLFSPAANFLAAACVGPNGIVYAITGNGAAVPGVIYAIDIFNGTEGFFASPDVTFGGNFQVGLNITYYPPTNELWIFGGTADSLIKIDVNTQVETRVAAFLNGDDALKATYLDGNKFWLCSDMSYTFDAQQADSVKSSTFTLPGYITDVELLDLVEGGDTLAICGSDSLQLRSRFRFDEFRWYFNGTPLPLQTRAIALAAPGTYQLLARHDNNGGFLIWSETVVVINAVSPTAGFGQSAFNVALNAPVTFTDSSLNASTYHWDFGDGSFSASTNPMHAYSAPGVYIVTQVVQKGLCTDTAYSTVTVSLVGVADAAALGGLQLLGCFPNPASEALKIDIWLDHTSHIDLEIYNLLGSKIAVIHRGELNAGSHQFECELPNLAGQMSPSGLYFVRLSSPEGSRMSRIVIQQ